MTFISSKRSFGEIFGQLVRCSSAALLVAACIGCSGGGGDGGSDSPDTPQNNACSVLRPKIIDGTSCSGADRLPIAEIIIDSGLSVGLCSGSLIASRFVLTAGHCFLGGTEDGVSYRVAFGDMSFPATRITRHPQYQETGDPNIVLNDVSVIELGEDVPINPLPVNFSVAPQVGNIISIFGYGLDENGGSGDLQSGQMQLTQVTDSTIFALFGDEGSNTCQGDSGGPATLEVSGQAAVIGVTSSGTTEGCVKGDNSSFANLQSAPIRSFLTSVVRGLNTI